jgi:hypothetical protein
MIYKYTAPCVMFLMHADPLQGQVGGGWALTIKSFLGIEPISECHLGPKKLEISTAEPPPACLSNGSAQIKNHYVQG